MILYDILYDLEVAVNQIRDALVAIQRTPDE